MEWRGFGTEEDDEYLAGVDLFSMSNSLYTSNSYYTPESNQVSVSPTVAESDDYQTMHADDAVLDSFDFDLSVIRSQLQSLPYLPQSNVIPSQPVFKKSWRDVVGVENARPPAAPPVAEVIHEEPAHISKPEVKEVCRYWLNVSLSMLYHE